MLKAAAIEGTRKKKKEKSTHRRAEKQRGEQTIRKSICWAS